MWLVKQVKVKLLNKSFKIVLKLIVYKISAGFPELGLPVFDPLKLRALDIEQGGNSPVNLKIHLRNFELIGLSRTKFISIQGFTKDYDKARMELKFNIPSWQILGPYKIDGRVLILPVAGK